MDTFALGRGDVLTTLPTSDLQKCAARITSVLDVIDTTTILLRSLPATRFTEHLIKSLLIVEVCNLVDCLYPPDASNPHAAPDLTTIIKGCPDMDSSALSAGNAARDAGLEQRLREVRNKIGAHVDGTEPLHKLLLMLDRVPIEEIEAVLRHAKDAFLQCCQVNIHLRPFLLQGVPFPVPLATRQAEGDVT